MTSEKKKPTDVCAKRDCGARRNKAIHFPERFPAIKGAHAFVETSERKR